MEENQNPTVNPNDINPVDYYNKMFIQDVFDKICLLKSVKMTGHNSFTYIVNKADENKRMIVIENGNFVATLKNGLNMKVGEPYTPFMMLQRFIYKNSFNNALSYVLYHCMNNESEYIRVGTKYIKKIKKTDRYDIVRSELKTWDKYTILDDHGRDFLYSIAKYLDFTIEPCNTFYESSVDGNYNLYAPFEHKICDEEDYKGESQWKWSKILMEHIFGEQYDKGIIYIKALYDLPKNAMPILVLISEERSTGKSTFVDWLSGLFGANMVVINPQDLSSSFNGSYADKNIIAIEESRFDSVQTTEKLKALATQKKILVNSKFIQPYSIPFYGKLIITSNDENKFSKVDDTEIRYWVRKVPSLKGKVQNHKILEDLMKEIPYFLHYLSTLEEIDSTKSRMIFEPEDIETDALNLVKKESRPEMVKEIEMYLDNHCQQNEDVEKFYFTALNVKDKFFISNNMVKATYINKLLKTFFKFEKIETSTRFVPLEDGVNINKIVGKPYVYDNPYYQQSLKNPDLEPTIDF